MKVFLLLKRVTTQGDLDVQGVFTSHIVACRAAGDPEPSEIPLEGPREIDDFVVQPWDLTVPANMNPALELARLIKGQDGHMLPQSGSEANRYLRQGLIEIALWLDQDVLRRAESARTALLRLLAIVS